MGWREVPREQDKPDRERASARRYGWIFKTHFMIIPTSIRSFIYLNILPIQLQVKPINTLKINMEVMFASISCEIRKIRVTWNFFLKLN